MSELLRMTVIRVDVCAMCSDRALTVRTLGQRNLLDACPVSTGEHFHLALVLVKLPVGPTYWFAVVATVPVTSAALKLLLLQAAKHIVAVVRLRKTCRRKCGFKKPMEVGCLWIF